jgi:arsenate reductase-like glutaredoxin family protein
MLGLRIIKSKDCLVCKNYLPRLDKSGIVYELYDADDPANQKQLDEWKIDDLPVVQIVNSNGSIKYQFPHGAYSPTVLRYKMEELAARE